MHMRHSQEKHILVVDDDPDILDFLHDLLELEGYTVAVSTKGEYLEKLQSGSLPDLILLDVFLSGRDGREIVKSLKNREETRQIPVIMFSAHPSAEKAAREAGADEFLEKPFNCDVLVATIAHFLHP